MLKATRIAIIMIACWVAVCGTPLLAASHTPLWEVIATTESGTTAGSDATTPTLDVRTVDGQIYVTVDKNCKIQVFTILGQLVSEKNVHSGTVRLTLGNPGIYILKAGAATRRINL